MIIGASGREASMARKISKSKYLNKLFIVGENPKIDGQCINLKSIYDMLEFAKNNDIYLTIVGPEKPLEEGIVDLFEMNNLLIFGPNKDAVKIETDKAYAKSLMTRNYIPTARYELFEDYDKAIMYAYGIRYPVVIKYTGLAFGKGVVICKDIFAYETACQEFLVSKKYGEGKIIIEDYLEGEEFSYICLVNGYEFKPFASCRDYKRISDNDEGLNTGGMGMISPHPSLTKEDLDGAHKIVDNILAALKKDKATYKGFLYAGLIKTDEGIKVIEFNARMGDPEGEILFNKMENDLLEQLINCLTCREFKIINDDDIHLGVVASAPGYPNEYEKNIDINDINYDECYLMNGKYIDDKIVSSGGRVLFYHTKGKTISECRDRVYNRLAKLDGKLYYRKDIGGNYESSCNNGIKE